MKKFISCEERGRWQHAAKVFAVSSYAVFLVFAWGGFKSEVQHWSALLSSYWETSGLNIELIKSISLNLHLNSGKLNAITLGPFSEFITSQYIFKATVGEKI